jgi:hypothetical protein
MERELGRQRLCDEYNNTHATMLGSRRPVWCAVISAACEQSGRRPLNKGEDGVSAHGMTVVAFREVVHSDQCFNVVGLSGGFRVVGNRS